MVGMDLINYLTRHFGSDSIRVACETTGYRMGILMANSNPAPGNLSFPKLLVVAAFPPNAPTLNIQCLKGYPPERIYWWSYLPEITAVYGQKYARHFHCSLPMRLMPQLRFNRIKCGLLDALWMPYARRHLLRTLHEVQPEQVWANIYGYAIGPIHLSQIASRVRTHSTFWDFPDIQHHQLRWGPRRCQKVLDWGCSIYSQSASCDTISEPMREELARKTGRQDAIIIHSGLEEDDIARLPETTSKSDGTIRIAYAGNINVSSVMDLFIHTLDRVRKRLNRRVRMEFFGTSCMAARPWFDPSWMHDNGVLEEDSLIRELRRCDWGSIQMDIDDTDPRYSRFSFPNKFGTYLAASLPILLISNHESTSAKMLKAHPVGVHLDHTQLEDHLTQVLASPNPRMDYFSQILACAKTEFYMPEIRKRLWQKLGVNIG